MNRADAVELLASLHAAQGDFYAGGSADPLRALLADEIIWTVPGHNAIAGRYRGVDEVMGYFARRRALAEGTFRIYPGEVLIGEGEHLAVLTDGSALIGGSERRWSTVGLYRIAAERIAACWLLPLDPEEFDQIWSGPGGS